MAISTSPKCWQGCPDEISFERTRRYLAEFQLLPIADEVIAISAARNFQRLRSLGITVRTTIDTLIATRCIVDGIALLHRDRDFQPFIDHLGLKEREDALVGFSVPRIHHLLLRRNGYRNCRR